MKNNKQTIIGFVLITIVFFGYVLFSNYQMEKYEAQKALESAEQIAEQGSAALAVEGEAVQADENSTAAVAAEPSNVQPADNFTSDTPVEEITLSNDVMDMRISTLGAQIVDVTLRDYTKYAPKEERNELVHMFDSTTAQFDISFFVKHNLRNMPIQTINRNFRVESVERVGDKQIATLRLPFGEERSLDFVYTLYDEKRLERDYLVDFEVRFNGMEEMMANQTSLMIDWSNRSYQNERSFKNENMYSTIAYRYPSEVGIEDLGISESNKSEEISTPVSWVAFKQQFFTSALIPRSGNFSYADLSFDTAAPKSGYMKQYAMKGAVAYSSEQKNYDFSFYFGPNKFAVLKQLTTADGESLQMERIIPLGWIFSTYISRWIVIPTFDFLCQYISSFGLIILILTILVKLLIFPLTYKSYMSMAKMRVLRPELEAINAKYPRQEDAMKKQQATMELYRKSGISPMSGCLPMLIQMPVLIAMFRFFPASIELRGQSFLWSDDLSSYDSVLELPFNIPFYGDHVSLFCLLMAVALFLYSQYNYKQTASTQPQMAGMKFMTLYMMPVMMLLWFNDYSSGLCYYYLLSNIFTMLQTFVIRLMVDDEKVRSAISRRMANTKGKKSRFQQRYEQMMRQAENAKK